MARYIDADKFLKDQIHRCGCIPLIGSCTMDNESLKDILEHTPTADVVEVKHGRWELKHIGVGHYWECSECEYKNCAMPRTSYCPHCGAKMDSQL